MTGAQVNTNVAVKSSGTVDITGGLVIHNSNNHTDALTVNMQGPGETLISGMLGVFGRVEIVAEPPFPKNGSIFTVVGNSTFTGNVTVTGDIALTNADLAEDFDVSGDHSVEPGTVMVIDHDGSLIQSQTAYDKRVAGVVAGAGTCKPAIILGKQESQHARMPLALLGKVFCRVDASYARIEVGDLLTTSPTPGHAMKATDSARCIGEVIGKALRPLNAGQDLVPILVALQ